MQTINLPTRFLAPDKYGNDQEYRIVRETAWYVYGTHIFTGQPIKRRMTSVTYLCPSCRSTAHTGPCKEEKPSPFTFFKVY